jgi:hypothetical protein
VTEFEEAFADLGQRPVHTTKAPLSPQPGKLDDNPPRPRAIKWIFTIVSLM